MHTFENDYSEGAAREILDALCNTSLEERRGYGMDSHCANAASLIKKEIKDENVDVHFVPGGTPCNTLACSLIKPYEAIISADSGHINVHETGAIEHTGHKIIEVPNVDGKLTAEEIEKVMAKHTDEHMVKPKLLFISNPSEFGTIYSKEELVKLRETADKYNLYLYMDGARLGSALTSSMNDLTMEDINKLCDLFYIGGTKNGALYGEAMVISNDELKPYFRYLLKQEGFMMAKASIMGITFEEFFKEDLYYRLAKHANMMAYQLKHAFKVHGIKEYMESYTNQLFVIMDNELYSRIKEKYIISFWDKYDDSHSIVRFVTSWATKQEKVDEFIKDLEKFTASK